MDTTLRNDFLLQTAEAYDFKCIVVTVRLPNGAREIITNFECIDEKIQYYINAYDTEFKLKSNPNVRIVDFMLVK